MPKIPWRLAALVQTLTDETLLAEALLFPGMSLLQGQVKRLRESLTRRLTKAIQELPPGVAYRRRVGELPQVAQLTLDVPPLKEDDLRIEPVNLTLHYVHWRHSDDAVVAYFPALQIEVLAADETELQEQLLPQVRSALARQKTAAHLRKLVLLEHRRSLRVRELQLRVKMPTLKQAAQQAEAEQAKEKSILKQVAFDLTAPVRERTYERGSEVERLTELLTGPMPRSVLLVGRSGSGKTAVVREMARRRNELDLMTTPLWSTSGSRIVAGMTGFGMWQERCQKLLKEVVKTKSIVHLDHLVELIEVGKGGGNLQGIASFLCPSIASGKMLAIAECTPQQLAIIEREDPQLLEAFVQLEIPDATPAQTRSILQQVAGSGLTPASYVIETAALDTIDRLHRRYAAYSAAPGRPLRFLRNLLADRAENQTITPPEVTAAFSQETGLPLFMLDDAVPLDVAATRRWFAERVIGQPQPVDLVVDLVASVKAGLARSGKPIASLLFIGPTGVGKTEMAKSLAEFLYQDPGRMIRFDMSEYAHPAAIERLIGGTACTQGLLTQKVRDQPFMVVLLDEFEKAHPLFFDVLLQVLGEGRLTDGAGRVADFTSAVVIMTSNLGAESFRGAGVGFGSEAARTKQAEQHFDREVKAFLRPEMFNRIDRIVPFAPLDQATIHTIARRELAQVAARDGIRLRGVNLQIADNVIDSLSATGYDPRYGARPLKRAIERQLVAPLADKLTRYGNEVVIDAQVAAEQANLSVNLSARPVPARGSPSTTAEIQTLQVLQSVIDLRRKLQSLLDCGILLQVRNEILRVKQFERQQHKRAKKRGEAEKFYFTKEQAKVLEQEDLVQRIDKLAQEVNTLEDLGLLDFYSGRTVESTTIEQSCTQLTKDLQEVLFELYGFQEHRPKTLTMALFGEDVARVCELARAYIHVCRGAAGSTQPMWLKLYRPDLDHTLASRPALPPHELPCLHLLHRREQEGAQVKKVLDVYNLGPQGFTEPAEDCIGVALQISGERAIALLEAETGKHVFATSANRQLACSVETMPHPLIAYEPPANVGRQGSFANLQTVREFNFTEKFCVDQRLQKAIPLRDKSIDEAVRTATEDLLQKRIWALLEQWN